MDSDRRTDRKGKNLGGIYRSSWGTSMITQSIMAIPEIFMLVYTPVNPALFGQYMEIYRRFYISLLTVAVVYTILNIYTVFMTFSLTVPLSFFLFPSVYTVIVVVADAVIFYIMTTVSASIGPMINLSIFIIFQLVLGISILRLKMKLAERIVKEHENAEIDVLTGFPNRRAFINGIRKLSEGPAQDGLVYPAIDMNEPKEVNDRQGHEAGGRLIVGAAECIEKCFGAKGRMYRIGGDEFAVILSACEDEMDALLEDYRRGNGLVV